MAVRVLRSAPSEHVEDLAYLMARLKGDPQAAVLATDVEPAWTSYQDKLTIVRSIAETCTQESEPKILQQAELLRAAADPMDAAFRRRSEARVAELAAYGRLQTRKIEAMDTCRRIGFDLTGRFPFNHERVRTFFRVNYRQTSTPAPEEPAAPAAVETPPAEVKAGELAA